MIRKAVKADMPRILEIYALARSFMKKTGNPNQWGDTRPEVSKIENQLSLGQLYVYTEDGRIQGAAAIIGGEDETYASIEGGSWLNGENYVTMHMVASSGETKGVFAHLCDYAKTLENNVRIDTHEDNKVMLRCIEKQGFSYCGIIHLADGAPRRAYQWVRNGP